jgi:tetratricopeptide (TPR) repeat protein
LTSPPSAAAPPPPGEAASLTTTIEPFDRGLHPGRLVAGKYRIVGEIGRGGMGVVYEADDVKLKRPVALKFLPAELTNDAEARARFVHEAQAASGLDNPHICTIHDIGESEDRRMFIAMALCNGESLRTKIKRAGPLSPPEALSLALQISDGLAAAHASGITHRDVKPANVLVSRDGTARVADFGLAKIAGEARLTRAGHAVGTVAYMSPEQLRGEDVDVRTDVWSLGVVLYEMLTGTLPFHGTTEHSLAFDIVNGPPKPLTALPAGTPPGCARVLEKALAKDPRARYASAVEMAEALADVRANAGYSGRLITRPEAGAAPRRRRRLVLAGLSVLAGAAALSLVFAFHIPARVASLLGLARPAAPDRGITVFVPTVLGDNPADRTLAAGFADYLRLRLDEIARRSRAWVTPGNDLVTHGVREASEALRVLGSRTVLAGTLKRVGDNISLTLDVFDPARYRRLASVAKTDHIANIATWQDDLVRETAAALDLAAPPPALARASAAAANGAAPASPGGTTVPGAFESYLRGLGHLAESHASSADPSSTAYVEALAAAVAALEESVGLDPSFVDAAIDLADAYRLETGPGRDRAPAIRAESLLRNMLEANDRLPRAHFVLGSLLRRLGRDSEAGPELERAVAFDPLFYDAWIRLAGFYEDTNEPARAEAAYRSAAKARPGYWAGGTFLAIFHYYHGEVEKARDELVDVVRRCPGNIIALNDLGAALFKLAAYDQAVAVFERSNAVKRNPDACANLATLYYYSGRYADSVNMNEAAIGFGPSDFTYVMWGNLGDAYHFTPGNEAKAAAAYAKAIALTEKALAVDPRDPRARATLAVDLAKSGQAARALEEMDKVLRALPGDATIRLRAVFLYEVLGDRPKALEALREYVKLKGPLEEVVRDPFLAGLRRDPGYADITAR